MDSFYEQHPYTITENYKNNVRTKDTKGKVHIGNKAHVKQYFQKLVKISCTEQGITKLTKMIWEMISSHYSSKNHMKPTIQMQMKPSQLNLMKLHLIYMLDSDQESNCNDDFSADTTDSISRSTKEL